MKTVDDLVRLGTQIEKDWVENKKRWNQGKDEEQRKKSSDRRGQKSHLMHFDPATNSQYNNILQTPIILNHTYFNAVIDTGSPFSLLQQKNWQGLRRNYHLIQSTQTFMLANVQNQ